MLRRKLLAVAVLLMIVGNVMYSRIPLIRTLVIRIANNVDRLDPSGKFVDNSTRVNFLGVTGYRIKYSTVLWLLELQLRRGRRVLTEVRIVNSNS